MGPKYISRGSLLGSAAKAPDHRRAVKVLLFTVFANRESPFIPRECASYENMEKQAQHTPPTPPSHLHNTSIKRERVSFVRCTCLCTSPVLPVPPCFGEHNGGSWGLSRSLFFRFSARVLTEAFTCGVIDALQIAVYAQGPLTWAGALWALTTQWLRRGVASAVPSPNAGKDCCFGTLGADAGSSPSGLCRTYCWTLSPNKLNQRYCVQDPLPTHPQLPTVLAKFRQNKCTLQVQ